MENLNEDLDNLSAKDKRLITNYSQNIKENIEKSILEINSLLKSIQIYRDTISDYITLSSQKSDLVSKYTKANTGGSFNLPAVFSTSLGSYDLNAINNDSKKAEEITQMLSNVENQKESAVKFICRNQADLTKCLSNLIKLNNELDTYLELLAQNSSWNSNNFKSI